MIEPTIGRKVWFWKSKAQFDAVAAGDKDVANQPEDASVCAVWNDRCVNLQVNNHNGVSRGETSVVLVQEGDQIPTNNFATWMPYQVKQAAAQG